MGQERSAFVQLIFTIGLRTIIIQFRDEESEAPRVGDLDQVIHLTGRWQVLKSAGCYNIKTLFYLAETYPQGKSWHTNKGRGGGADKSQRKQTPATDRALQVRLYLCSCDSPRIPYYCHHNNTVLLSLQMKSKGFKV